MATFSDLVSPLVIGTVNIAGGSNVTLTTSQTDPGTLILVGALTANITVYFPARLKFWSVVNNTTGAFTVTLAMTGGAASVTVAQGYSRTFYSDGTSGVYLSNSDASNSVLNTVDINGGTIDNTPIGSSAPSTIAATSLTASGPVSFTGTGALVLPVGTAAQQPTTLATRMVRFNSTTGRFEFYNGTTWINHVRLNGDVMTGNLTTPALIGSTTSSTLDSYIIGSQTPLAASVTSFTASLAVNPSTDASVNLGAATTRFQHLYQKGVEINASTVSATPTTGSTVTIAQTTNLQLIDPAGTLAALTITLPTPLSDGHSVEISFSQLITALTINSATGSVQAGAPTTITSIGSSLRFRYYAATTTWRVTGSALLGNSIIAIGNGGTNATTAAAAAGNIGTYSVVNSIAALKAFSKTDNSHVFVTGYYNPLDGGGGQYYYDSTDTTSADNGGSIIVASDGGRWKLVGPADWYVEQFGGGGIGGGANDSVYIQNAINALPLRGGTVRLMGKQYNIATTISIGNGNGGTTSSTRNGIKLIGTGGGFGIPSPPSTNLQATAAITGAMIVINGAISDVYLEGFKLYANLQAQGCIYLTASCGTQIKNVTGNQYTSYGMWWHGGVSPTGNYNISNQINNCFFSSTANNHNGLVMDGNYSVSNDTWLTTFTNCRFDTSSATGSNAAYLAFVDSITFTRCHFVGNNTSGVGLSGCYGVYFNAVGNNGFPSGINFQFCSVLSTFVNETTDTMRKCTFEGFGTYDNETIPTSARLIGYTDQGVRFGGWGS